MPSEEALRAGVFSKGQVASQKVFGALGKEL